MLERQAFEHLEDEMAAALRERRKKTRHELQAKLMYGERFN
jgi:hypothetical protein